MLLFSLALAGPLDAWVPWIVESHPEWACVQEDPPLCVWPGIFSLQANSTEGRFTLLVRVDRDAEVALPGGRGAWPEEVRGEAPVVVLDRDGVPTAVLKKGVHTLTGHYRWTSMPQGLAVPAGVGLVRLWIEGEEVEKPRVDAGSLRLGAGDAPGESRLELDVLRKIQDGVPAVVQTRLILRASGSAREVNFGNILVPNTRAISLDTELPARMSAEGELVVQVRPGAWTVQVDAMYSGPMHSLESPKLGDLWPDAEYWVFAANEQVRAVTLSGPPGVDPARTPLSEDWKGLPTWRVSPGTPLTFTELRRGQPEPPPNRLILSRELWLDYSGQGMTVRDVFSGELNRSWRLDATAPFVPGHVAENTEDQVITVGKEGSGVELRNQNLTMVAESRAEGVGGVLGTVAVPAVGWNVQVSSLAMTLHIPEGWLLVAATGVDHAASSLVEQWTLLDAIAVLLIGLLSARSGGAVMGGLAAVAAVLTRQSELAPTWTWLVALLVVGLPTGRWADRIKAVFMGMFVLSAGTFVAYDLHNAAFPQLVQGGEWELTRDITTTEELPLSYRGSYSKSEQKQARKERNISLQVDASTIVQTGPGIPAWQGQVTSLSWDGPVSPSQKMKIFLLSPHQVQFLALIRSSLLVLVMLRLVIRKFPREVWAILIVLLALVLPQNAQAQDNPAESPVPQAPQAPDLLKELETRLAPQACQECVSVPSLDVVIRDDKVRLLWEVHTSVSAAWAIPGPAATWTPSSIEVDGKPALALVRSEDGFVRLRLEPGAHTVVLTGAVTDSLILQFLVAPKRVALDIPGFIAEGVRPDGSGEGSLQLIRTVASQAVATELVTRLEVHRFLDLGFPWRVRTELRRVGEGERPISVKVPLLAGESVTDDGFVVKEGTVLASLGRETQSVSWLSTLDERESLTLTAPENVAWTEIWELSCSPVFSCTIQGPPALQYTEEGAYAPQWRPWPGESLTISVGRPDAAPGQTLTVDSASLAYKPGPRLTEATLRLSVRSSQGGKLPMVLPVGAEVTRVELNGTARPMVAQAGKLDVPLSPGAQTILVGWQQPWTLGQGMSLPKVNIGASAVNIEVKVELPKGRWVAWVGGADIAPSLQRGVRLLVLLGLGFLARRILPGPGWGWVWLAVGLHPLPWPVFVLVMGWWWLVSLPKLPRIPDLLWRLVLGGGGLGVLLVVALAAYVGLVESPDSDITGPGSSRYMLRWFEDRVEGELPAPVVVAPPLYVWRLGMLVWTLGILAKGPAQAKAAWSRIVS